MRAAVDALEPVNANAWEVFTRIATRFVVDVGLGHEVVRRKCRQLSDDDSDELLDRLSLIYDIVMPERNGTD